MADINVPSTPPPSIMMSPAEAANEPVVKTDIPGEGIDASAEPKADAAPKTPEAVKNALKKKLKLKVDGEEFEEEIDWENDQDLIKRLQLSKVAQKRMNEKATLERDVEQFLKDLRTNPRKVLSDPRIGLDVKRLAAEIIEEEVNNAKKSPEQLERERLETRLKELEEERENEKKTSQQREFERLQQQEVERYDTAMTKALEKSDLPKSAYIVKKMADYMLMGLNEGLDVAPEDVLPLVREELQNDLKEMFAIMPDEVIEALVGKEVFSRVRKKNVLKAKSPQQPMKAKIKDIGQKDTPAAKPGEKKSMKDFFGF
jgi:hypothetical protein